jgi:hypothetical protein
VGYGLIGRSPKSSDIAYNRATMKSPVLRTRIPLAVAGLLLAANILVPLVWGDVYPFTSAPMFRDVPVECCNYAVYAPDGRELWSDDWLVQRIYDGNPVGYGVGVYPPTVLEQTFGVVHDQASVCRHIERRLAEPHGANYSHVEVEQRVIGPIDGQCVGVVRTQRWRIARP